MDQGIWISKQHLIKLYSMEPECLQLYMVHRETTNRSLIPIIYTSFDEIYMRLRWDNEKIISTNRLLIEAKIIIGDGNKMVFNMGDKIISLSEKKNFRYALLKEINKFPKGDNEDWNNMYNFLQQIKKKIETSMKEGRA